MSSRENILQLKEWFKKNTKGNVFIALSGGVDSAVVALAAKKALGKKAIAITANYKTLALFELEDAKRVAHEIGIKHLIIEYNELEDENFVKNDINRCYYCRKSLGENIKRYEKDYQVTDIVDGTHLDDIKDYRPGLKAIREYKIKSPLLEKKIGKKEIREIARRYNISVANKPSNSCLASRIPYGNDITQEKLKKIEIAEEKVKELFNISQVRVRDHGEIARIEIGRDEMEKMFNKLKLYQLDLELKNIGFKYASLDLYGYRSGKLIVIND
ncbi:MAG TPA: ATP-dependent sacrificial sulfur transferase LarE [Nitrososphaeraceae archaeon]|nr:ATP-dependent sacrificial sulfur transferase LarE [Nitrososphaeraceae archaeon]